MFVVVCSVWPRLLRFHHPLPACLWQQHCMSLLSVNAHLGMVLSPLNMPYDQVKALEAAQAARKAEEARLADKARQREAAGGASKHTAAAELTSKPGAAVTGAAAVAAAPSKPKNFSRVPVAVEAADQAASAGGSGVQRTPAGAVAAAKVAAVEKAAAGQAGSGSGGAVRVPVMVHPKAGEDEGARRPALDKEAAKEAAKRRAERDAEAAKK